MSVYEIKQLDRTYNQDMLRILRDSPIESRDISLRIDRQPDIFIMSDLKYSPSLYLGIFLKKELVGFIMTGFHDAYVNGHKEKVGHISNFYLSKKVRSTGIYYKLSDQLYNNDLMAKTSLLYSIIMEGNKNAEIHINRRHERFPSIPKSTVIGKLLVKTIIITTGIKERSKFKIRRAKSEDIDIISEMLDSDYRQRLFAPPMDKDSLRKTINKRDEFDITNYFLCEKDGNIVGLCAAWDCSTFKQNTVIWYGKKLKWKKFLLSALSPFSGMPKLPSPGQSFREINIVDYTTKDRDPEIMEALLIHIYNISRKKNYNTIIFGSNIEDPLLKSTDKFTTESIVSHIVSASVTKSANEFNLVDKSMPYIDVASL